MKRIKKGRFGYINNQKKYTISRTVLLFALALGLYAVGYYTTGSNKNLLTIIAILGLLPASKSCVNMIMFLRFKSIDKSIYDEMIDIIGTDENDINDEDSHVLFESVLTTTEKSYYLPVIFYKNLTIVSYCENKSKEAIATIEEHIKKSMKIEKLEVTVKVFNEKDQFIDRMKGMLLMEDAENDAAKKDIVYNTIKVISL